MQESELFKSAQNRAMALCAAREYCTGDIFSKLQGWGLSDRECFLITEKLKKDNFINEERYARGFVNDKFHYNKWGRIKIAAHLKARHIPGELIRSAMEAIDEKTYRQTLENLLATHRRSVKAKNKYDLRGKLLRFGLSRGFESGLLYDILNDYED
jgi:regulatory protein